MEQQINSVAGAAQGGLLFWISNPITQVLLWPLLGCLIVSLIPATNKLAIRLVALTAALLSLGSSILMLTGAGGLADLGIRVGTTQCFPLGQYQPFVPNPQLGFQFLQDFHWMALRFGEMQSFGVDYSVGVDELSMPLVLLCTVTLVMVVLWAWKREKRIKEFLALTLFMQVGIIGSFVALDYVLLYLFWEWMLIPMFFLIAGWGKDREKATRAALKFFIYTLLGSVFLLIAFIQLQVYGQGQVFSFSIPGLAVFGLTDGVNSMAITVRLLIFIGMLLGFAVKAPMWPFHTWLPDAHSEAPTEMSVILAALMLKCGTYAYLRCLYSTFPDICYHAGPVIAFCGVVAIVYGAGVTLMQTDLKRMVAYSSISHMGFIILGISAMNPSSTTGAIFHMVGHGVLIALLFFLVGWIEERYGTRDMRQLAGLWQSSPQVGGLLTLAAFAGMGFPGLIAFWGELFILQGTYFNNPQWLSVIIPSPGALLHLWTQVGASNMAFNDNRLWFGPQAAGLSGASFLQLLAGLAVIGVLTSAVYMINMLLRVVFSGKTLTEPQLVVQPAFAGGIQPTLEASIFEEKQPSDENSETAALPSQSQSGKPRGTRLRSVPIRDLLLGVSWLAAAAGCFLHQRYPAQPLWLALEVVFFVVSLLATMVRMGGVAWNQALVLYPLAAAVIFLGLNPQPLIRLIADVGNLLAATQWGA